MGSLCLRSKNTGTRRHKEGRTPIRPVHAKPMKSAPPSLIGTSWTSADRSPPLRAKPMKCAPPSLIGASWTPADRSPPLRAKPMESAPQSPIGTPRAQGGADSDPPRPCEANEKRFAFIHSHPMHIGSLKLDKPTGLHSV